MRLQLVSMLLLTLAPPAADRPVVVPAPEDRAAPQVVIVPEKVRERPKPRVGLDGKHFYSVLAHEGGLTPTGPARAAWHLEFTADRFTWDFSDLRTGGGYCYDPVTGEICTLWFSKDVAARFDLKSGLLEWDGNLYREVAE